MWFRHRSFAGKTFRPSPVLLETELPSLVILSSWGGRDEANRVGQIFQDQLSIADIEDFTSPFGHLDNLSAKANRLRTACFLANEHLYRDVNNSEYLVAIEALAIVIENNILSWVQVGGPHLFLHSAGVCQPLAYNLDWSWQYHQDAPLPCQALGMETSINVNCGTVVLPADGDLILVSRGAVPATFFQLGQVDLETMSRLLIQDNPETPFWIAQIKQKASA